MAVYKVPNTLVHYTIAAYMLQYGDIVSGSHDSMRG